MKAIAFTIRLSSLYSIRIPYSWQSALTYPVPPPSAIIGMLANALQRYRNNLPPLYYLDKVEENVIWAGARLLSPAIVRSYTTSAITKWDMELGRKSTNALGREYVFTRSIKVAAVIKKDSFIQELMNTLRNVPITCGDSESIATIGKISPPLRINESELTPNKELRTKFPIPFDFQKIEITASSGRLYLVHERCKKKGKEFPLVNYLFPLREKNGVLYPTELTIKVKSPVSLLKVESIGTVVKSI